MYEQFRDEVMGKLSDVNPENIKTFLNAMDQVAAKYDIKIAETQLTVYGNKMPEMVKSFLVNCAIEGLSKNTVMNYKRTLETLFKTIHKPIDKLTANDMRVWFFEYEQTRNVSKSTLNQYRTVISEFFEWAYSESLLNSNPMLTIKPIKYTQKPKKAMGQLELEYFRNACETPQELAVVEILYSTGCRVSELSNMKKSDIDWDKHEVILLGKGSKYRTCYLNAKSIIAIQKYLETRNDNDEYLIVSTRAPHHLIGKTGIERIIKRISNRIGDKLGVHVTPHIFRHTTATIALSNGMPIQNVQKMLGHSNINTTMIYAEVTQASTKEAHNKYVV